MFEFFKNLSFNKTKQTSRTQESVVSISELIIEQTIQYLRCTYAALHGEIKQINPYDEKLTMHIMTLFIAHQFFYLELYKKNNNNFSSEKYDAYTSEILKRFMEELIQLNQPKEVCLAEGEYLCQLNEYWDKTCIPSNDPRYIFNRKYITNELVWKTLEIIGFDIDPLEGTMPSNELWEKHGLLPTLSNPIPFIEIQEIGIKSARELLDYLCVH